jgi:lipopolysaccharide export system protein LptC
VVLSLKNSASGFLLIIAVGLSIWSILISKKPLPLTTTTSQNRPDAIMENVTAIILNKEGAPSLKIEAPKMIHYAENDATDIQKPHITLYRQSPEPWYINSNYAKATQGIEQIFFWDHVVIHHPRDIANPATTMTTVSLTVFPSQQLAKTNDNVTLIQPDTIINGLGMLANLNDGTIQLLAQARGEYVPSSS